MKKSKIAQVVSIILKLMFIGGLVSLFFIPTFYDAFADSQVMPFSEQTIYYKIAFYLCVIGSLGVIYCLTKIFDNVYTGSPFNKATVINLKIIAVLFMILSIIVIIKIIFIPTMLSIAVAFVTFMVSLSFYVLSQVFKVAIAYKDEVEYTV